MNLPADIRLSLAEEWDRIATLRRDDGNEAGARTAENAAHALRVAQEIEERRFGRDVGYSQ